MMQPAQRSYLDIPDNKLSRWQHIHTEGSSRLLDSLAKGIFNRTTTQTKMDHRRRDY